MIDIDNSHEFTDKSDSRQDKPLVKSTIPGSVLGTVELAGGLKEISVFHDIFLRYAFHEPDELALANFRNFVNIYIHAAVDIIGDKNISIRTVPKVYNLETQWRHLTYKDEKPTVRDNDIRAKVSDNITYVEFQNSLKSIQQEGKPPITIEDRAWEYFALGVNSNTYQKTTDLIWFFTKSKTDDESLALDGFTSFSCRRDTKPFDKLPVTSPSTILWVDLPAVLRLDECYDTIESVRLARQLTRLLYGESIEYPDDIVNRIISFLKYKFHTFKSEQEVVEMLTRTEIQELEMIEKGIEKGKIEGIAEKALEALKKGMSPEDIKNFFGMAVEEAKKVLKLDTETNKNLRH